MKHLLPHVELPYTVLVSGTVFFLLFLGIVALVYSKGRKKTYEETSVLPLEDGIEVERVDSNVKQQGE